MSSYHTPGVYIQERHVSPTRTGVILIRRLAPTEEDYDGVVSAAASDRCAATKQS